MISAPPRILLIAIELGVFSGQMQSGQRERVTTSLEERGDVRFEQFRIAPEDFGGGDRHRRIKKDLHCRIEAVLFDALVQKEQDLLGALQRERRDDDVAATRECLFDGQIKLIDRRLQRSVLPIAVGRFHHHDICRRRRNGIAQQRPPGVAEVARKQDASTLLVSLDEDAGRTKNVAGIEEGRAKARFELHRRAVIRGAAEMVEAVERIDHGVERLRSFGLVTVSPCDARTVARLFFLKMGGIEQDQANEFTRRRGGDDLAAESALHQQRQPAAVIEMGVGQQEEVHLGRIETERLGVLFVEFAAALEHPAIDEDAAPRRLDHVAGAGDIAVRPMERQLHRAHPRLEIPKPVIAKVCRAVEGTASS